MTLDSNTHPHDELAAYALDALEPGESAAIEAHLETCAACRAELDRHLDTLAHVVAPEEPPPELWDRIASQLPAQDAPGGGLGRPSSPSERSDEGAGRGFEPPASGAPDADQATLLPLDTDRPRHAGPRRRAGRPRPTTTWLVAAAAAVVVVVGVALVSLRSTGSESTVTDLAESAADDPDSTVVRLTGSDGAPEARVVLTDQGTGYVLLDELPRLPEGRSYQLWKMNGSGQPVSLGVLGDGSAEAAAFALPADTTAFAISEEPDGGVPEPTGPIVADGEQA